MEAAQEPRWLDAEEGQAWLALASALNSGPPRQVWRLLCLRTTAPREPLMLSVGRRWPLASGWRKYPGMMVPIATVAAPR